MKAKEIMKVIMNIDPDDDIYIYNYNNNGINDFVIKKQHNYYIIESKKLEIFG